MYVYAQRQKRGNFPYVHFISNNDFSTGHFLGINGQLGLMALGYVLRYLLLQLVINRYDMPCASNTIS